MRRARRVSIKSMTLTFLFLTVGWVETSHPAAVQPTSLSGWFTVIWGDGEPTSLRAPQMRYLLTDDSGRSIQLLLTEEIAWMTSACSTRAVGPWILMAMGSGGAAQQIAAGPWARPPAYPWSGTGTGTGWIRLARSTTAVGL
jgi:hypothetical protein